MSIKPGSRNNFAVVRRIVDSSGNNTEHDQLDIRPQITKTNHPDNRRIEVLPHETWSHLAWRTLGNGRLWWLIADYSKIVDPFREIQRRDNVSFLDSLMQDIQPGPVSSIRVSRQKRFRKGVRLLIEDMATGFKLPATVIGLGPADEKPALVYVAVSSELGDWVRAATSRIMRVDETRPFMTAPTSTRAAFESADYRNPRLVADELANVFLPAQPRTGALPPSRGRAGGRPTRADHRLEDEEGRQKVDGDHNHVAE